MYKKVSVIIIAVFSLCLFSSCKDIDISPRPAAQTQSNNPDTQVQEETVSQEPETPKGASARADATLAVPEATVDGVILQEWYEFEYPDDFRSFVDSCIEYSQNEDAAALSDLCGYGGSNQDIVKKIKQCCLDGIGMYEYRKYQSWYFGGGPGRDLWHYSFWYEGYRCVLYFLDGENTHYEWIEFWLIPDDGKGYASFFYPGSKYRGDEQEFLVIDCKNGIFDGEFYGTGIYSDEDVVETMTMSGNLKHGVLDGESVRGDETVRYENGRMMEYWKTADPSNVTDVDGYKLNLPEYFYTAGHRRCIYKETDRGIVWDPF